ncbi:hypothetical protein [Psychrobacter urativorans]|uniref:MBL fold metallo-hydrolase n=1 Tax=Psychrobacter urativorans TaxID=45610 RepID=A0A0M4U8A8_9GAMM|nr:hypothetical protein [Psychrobacter urativorans]ALF60651.1 hypothetical protein AOC03_11860 [Psychrobacter urativorans]
MSHKIHDLGSGFWNIRGSFRIGGIIDVGTQCSLVRLQSGRFIFLDSYTLTDDVRAQVMTLTNNGADVEAVLNVHPFHTVHCAQMATDFPHAIFYGSSRHPKQVPEVHWADDLVESDAVTQRYPELEFSLPQGIHYISPNEKIHAGSLLVFHPASQNLHVDDTFISPPFKLLEAILPELSLHPMTKKALLDKPNAGKHYCDWATQIAHQWRETRNFCAAHSGLVKFDTGEFETALLTAIYKARPKLENS